MALSLPHSSSHPHNNHSDPLLLNKMADSLRAEVAEQFSNMSLQDYFSQLAMVSLGPLNVYDRRRNESGGAGVGVGGGGGGGGEEGVEISPGVAWTLVAPLILLVVLVLLGITAACLWRLKDRRFGGGGRGPVRDDQGNDPDGVPEEEIEMRELQGGGGGEDPLQGLHGPAADGPPLSADGHHGLHGPHLHYLEPAARFRYSAEGAAAYSPRHQHHRGFPRDGGGIQDGEGIQLNAQYNPSPNPKLEILVANLPDMMNPGPGKGSSQNIQTASLESVAHLLGGGGEVPKELYCTVCQCYMAQRYQGPLFHPHLHPHHYTPQHHHSQLLSSPGGVHPHHAVYEKLPPPSCQQCSAGNPGVRHHHHHPQLLGHGESDRLHHPSPSHHEKSHHHRRRISQSVDDYLHLVPHYQPPHPAAFRPLSELQDTVYQRLLQHQNNPPPPLPPPSPLVHDPTQPDLSAVACHGVENPLFSAADADEESSASSISGRRDSPVGNTAGRGSWEGGSEERGRGRLVEEEGARIINSTSMMSNYGGDSDPRVWVEERHHSTKRQSAAHLHGHSPAAGDLAGGGPDVSSIQRVSSLSASQAWPPRGTCGRLLPSTTVLSSSQTPSYHTTPSIPTPTTDENTEGEEQGETLSLPSSISRFHASRVQFPPLMPDAQYPLTSTKAFYSPSWPGQSSRGEGNLLEGLENFSDNTSMQPNVGSSVTSGPASDFRESQVLSSSLSDHWAAPVLDIPAPPPPPTSPSSPQPAKEEKPPGRDERQGEGGGDPADREVGDDRGEQAGEGDHRERVPSDQVYEDISGYPSGPQMEVTPDFGDPGGQSSGVSRKGVSSSPRVPQSASELHRARVLKGRKRKDPKQGFFLLPKQDSGSGADSPRYDQGANHFGHNVQTLASPGHVASPSVRQVGGRPPVYRKVEASVALENVQHPATMRENSRRSPRAEFPAASAQHPYRSSWDGQRDRFEAETHPLKLLSRSKQSVERANQSHSPTNQGTPGRLRVNYGKMRNVSVRTDPNTPSAVYKFNATYPVGEFSALKASMMSASFPNVSHDVEACSGSRGVAPTVASRWPAVTLGQLKRTKSEEDRAYVNKGSSSFEEKSRSQSVPSSSADSGQTTDSLFASLHPTPGARHNVTLPRRAGPQFSQSRGEQKDQPSFSGTRTESQILAEILSSFPQSSVSSTNTSLQQDSRQRLSTVYNDVTIPTAFADELFGIWSLSPELDANSQPRTPLMTPLKEEARRANRKFIWGHSNSPSGSTSTSSFATAWPSMDDASVPGDRRRNLSHQTRFEKEFGDDVLMDNTGSDQPPSSSQQMSISDSPSGETAPPTPTVRKAEGNASLDNVPGPGTGEYRTLPLNNLNVSHLYVISGYPDKDSFNNNATQDLVDSGHLVSNVTSSPQPNATSTSVVGADVHNRNSLSAGFAVVLEKQKHWL